uniref:Mrr_cat domain-containing protein n=1 Tax=Haemonchus contortus TaxID=6289 RepID=A0A7I4XXP5_HAECO|nr:unnamed protein product [Haemonchus contortus]
MKFLSALDSQFGVNFREFIEKEEVDFTKWIMRFTPLDGIYGLSLSVPTVWPGVLRNDYIELLSYQERDKYELMEKWFTNVRSSVHAPNVAGCRAEKDMIALRMAIIEDGVIEVERCYTGDGLLPGINSRSFTVKIGPISSSSGQDLDFKTIDFLRTRLVHNGVVVQHKYKRPDDLHVASRLVSTGYPSKRYIIALSKNISGAMPAALSGEGIVIAIEGDKGVRPEGSRKDVAAYLELLSREADSRRVALKQAAEAAMADAYAKGLVPSRVPEEMEEVHATAADITTCI